MMFNLRHVIVGFVVILGLSGCASSPNDHDGYNDPFEGFNRAMFSFNQNVLDHYVVRPTAVFWKNYVPKPARTGLSNAMSNLSEPSSMVNYLLQGEGRKASIHFTRFFLNTVFGLGGLIDIASMANPDLAKEDPRNFGNVLGHYGVGSGPYFVLPGYGSATITQEGASYVDYLYAPLNIMTFTMSAGRWAVQGIETRAQLLDQDKLLLESKDPYAFMRAAYFQRRDFLNKDGKIEPLSNPNEKAIAGELDDIDSE